MHWKATQTATRLVGALAALCLLSTAHAGTVDFTPVVGTIEGSNTVVFEFDIVGSGTSVYRAILTDLESPAAFQIFGVGIATLDGIVLALVGGVADADVNIGTFGLEISNVPVPGVGLLMMSALTTLGFFMRRR